MRRGLYSSCTAGRPTERTQHNHRHRWTWRWGATCVKTREPDKEKEVAILLSRDEEDLVSTAPDGRSTEEIKNYLQDRTKVDCGPSGWWKNNQDRYLTLVQVAKQLLCILATSTPSEHIFSKAGFLVKNQEIKKFQRKWICWCFLAHNTKKCG